ncbi:MAG: hypothetical protein MI757_12220 [Pirellulales bacterium]|nr:hypothetical protein [Pirellulales bacterium]
MAEESQPDRTRIVKKSLHDADDRGIIRDATPAERMLMVWPMTLDAWAFKDPDAAQLEFQRHVVRVRRGRG